MLKFAILQTPSNPSRISLQPGLAECAERSAALLGRRVRPEVHASYCSSYFNLKTLTLFFNCH